MTDQNLPAHAGVHLTETGTREIERLPALAAAGRILAWRDVLVAIGTVAEVQIMAACWAIRREHPDQKDFGDFVYRALPSAMTPTRAWQLADLWSIARRHRPALELVNGNPRRAELFIADFARTLDVDRTEDGDPDLGPDEREIVDLMMKRGKARREGLKAIAAERQAARQRRHPDDVARIAELEAERDVRAAAPEPPPAQRAAAALQTFADQEAALVDTARAIRELCAAGAFSEHMRQRLLRIADNANSTVAVIADAVHEEPPHGPRHSIPDHG